MCTETKVYFAQVSGTEINPTASEEVSRLRQSGWTWCLLRELSTLAINLWVIMALKSYICFGIYFYKSMKFYV